MLEKCLTSLGCWLCPHSYRYTMITPLSYSQIDPPQAVWGIGSTEHCAADDLGCHILRSFRWVLSDLHLTTVGERLNCINFPVREALHSSNGLPPVTMTTTHVSSDDTEDDAYLVNSFSAQSRNDSLTNSNSWTIQAIVLSIEKLIIFLYFDCNASL